MYTLTLNNSIEGLEALCCKKDRWTKSLYVIRKVLDKMEFWFIEPVWGPICSAVKKVLNRMFEVSPN